MTSYLFNPNNHLFNLARQGQRLPNLFAVLLLSFVFILLGNSIGGILTAVLLGPTAFTGEAFAQDGTAAASGLRLALALILGFAPVFLLIWVWLIGYEKRPFWTLGFEKRGALWKYLRGLLMGLLFFGGAVLLMAVPGYVAFETGPAHLQGMSALGGVLIVTLGWMVQGAGEEVLCRGWVLPVVGARYRPWLGVLVSSLIFTVLHGLNPNLNFIAILNIFLVGIFTALYALSEGGMWGICAWHSGWNWAQGNLLGFEVSGQEISGGILLNLMETGPDAITGGAFGPEGGLAVTVVILIGIAALLLRRKRSPLPEEISVEAPDRF
ncbi:MAG TPA: type II CAAX endopeptidase family protein [Blastocatellia bacterium]|nr:type II CAAX endopeptidase family protein [Blastocatellia bacterium]